jgi:hypothetical protein
VHEGTEDDFLVFDAAILNCSSLDLMEIVEETEEVGYGNI